MKRAVRAQGRTAITASKREGPEFLFLDEAQYLTGWGTWIKHQVDFVKNRRIVCTGSAMPQP